MRQMGEQDAKKSSKDRRTGASPKHRHSQFVAPSEMLLKFIYVLVNVVALGLGIVLVFKQPFGIQFFEFLESLMLHEIRAFRGVRINGEVWLAVEAIVNPSNKINATLLRALCVMRARKLA